MFLKGKRNSCYFIERPQRKFLKKQETVGLHFFLHIDLLTWDLFFVGTKGKWAASSTLKLEGQPQESLAIRTQRGLL